MQAKCMRNHENERRKKTKGSSVSSLLFFALIRQTGFLGFIFKIYPSRESEKWLVAVSSERNRFMLQSVSLNYSAGFSSAADGRT